MTIRAALLDIDGTLSFRGEAIPGAAATLEALRAMGLGVRLLTNIDSRPAAEVARELAVQGLPVRPEEIFTPLTALQAFLEVRPEACCHFLLSDLLLAELGDRESVAEGADFVVVGHFFESFTYERLNRAFRLLMDGAQLVALQNGRYFVRAEGLYLDIGAIVRGLEYAAGVTALVLGKPAPDFFLPALEQLGCGPAEAVVVGDDATTDGVGAAGIGAAAVLVRTGKFSDDVLAASGVCPAAVLASVADLPGYLRRS